MRYEIKGGSFPVAVCKMSAGEAINCEAGAMSWMDPTIQMETKSGGLGKLVGRVLTNETLFLNRYVANADGEIAFSANSPGEIRAIDIQPGRSVVCQKGAFLASDESVDLDIFFQKKIGTGFFGGEGFVMQKLSGQGTALIEIDGSTVEYELAAGESKTIDSGYLVMMDDTCSIDVVMIKGVKNVLFGGEGLFNTVVTGPGRIVLQTMPMVQIVARIASMMSTKS
ncbi:MAG: TIGR00266 family protein [Lachnospiraceae bacterium]|nr:TIGR00266 family protein [Lachnospiraceae bacterium]